MHGIAPLTAPVICLMRFFGGLVMSAIKRDRGGNGWASLLGRLAPVMFTA